MTIKNDEGDKENGKLQQTLEEIYHDSIILSKKEKELKNMMEVMAKESKELKKKAACMMKDLDQSIFINKELTLEVEQKDKEMLNLLGESQKLSNMLLDQKIIPMQAWARW